MKREDTVKKLVRLSMFLAMGIVLNIVESMIPLPFAIPGIKLGLANTMGLIVLYFYGYKEYISISLLRILLVGLLRSGIGSPSFFISLGGFAISAIAVFLVNLTRKESIYSLSVISALFHEVGQVIVVMILYKQVMFINYLPILLVSGFISGFLVALVSSKVIDLLEKIFR